MSVQTIGRGTLITSDSRRALKIIGENRADSVVTDPPYELGFMGKGWDKSGIAFDVDFWRDVLRVLKPGGHLLAFGGTRTYHRMTCAIEDAGFEIRDSLHWMYGTGFPKSLNVGDGRGTALKPGHEPIVLARKPLVGTVAANVSEFGTGALNIDGCRIEGTPAPFVGGTARTNGILGTSTKREPWIPIPGLGRWPANVLLDEDAAGELDEQSGERRKENPRESGTRENGARGVVDFKSGSVSTTPNDRDDGGGASRFFYVAKPSRAERDRGCDHLEPKTGGEATDREDGSIGTENPRAGAGRTGGARNYHPTVKPIALMRYLVRLVTPPNGLVLDPFAGSGTTGIAALEEGVRFLGIEREAEYATIAAARMRSAL